MAQNVKLYNLLISCPGDVKDEVLLVESAVNEFNELYAEPLGIIIKTRHWSKSSYAQSGGKPQDLLNKQFVNNCDAAVAIFWTRFGTPTDKYGSGTEEEIEIMLKSGRQVFMYFSDKPIPPSQMSDDGYKKIQALREKYKDRGIYFTYSSNEEFKKLFFAHLSMCFLYDKKSKETAVNNLSELKLMGIDENGKLSEDASIYPFVLNAPISIHQFLEKIRSMYLEIAAIKVGKRTVAKNTFFTSFLSPADIDDKDKKFITKIAEKLELNLPDDFFDLGNLNKNELLESTYGTIKLEGSSEEIKKYRKIEKLNETISKLLKWAPVETSFSDKRCLRLAVQNCGKAIDEDVEITFEIPKKSLITLNEFPRFTNDEMGYLLDDCDMSILFGITATAEYFEYSESKKTYSANYVNRTLKAPGYYTNYSDCFIEKLNDVFCYLIFSNDDNYIIKLKVDYIKHNTTVAFPSVLFVKDDIIEIPYKITAKNNPDVVNGILKFHN